MQDPRERQREMLRQGITQCLDELRPGSGQVVRQQVDATDPAAYEGAALACLGAAEAAGGSAEAGVAGAVAVALAGQMALVFTGLESGGAGIGTAWGMPRSLNAGDAMFALAQESILTAPNELTAEERLRAAGMLDGGVRTLMEALYFAGDGGGAPATTLRALLPVALSLGGLLGGANVAGLRRLERLGREWALLPDAALARALASDPAGWLAS